MTYNSINISPYKLKQETKKSLFPLSAVISLVDVNRLSSEDML